jgi:Heat-labile enterotoxin alpha chain
MPPAPGSFGPAGTQHPGSFGPPGAQHPGSPGAQHPGSAGPAGTQPTPDTGQGTPDGPPQQHTPPPPGPDGGPPVAIRHVDPSTYGVDPSKVAHRDVPGWMRDENALYRGDTRSPEEIKAAGGFDVPRPDEKPDLLRHVDAHTNAYVSTSSEQHKAMERAGVGEGKMYVVKAPGGIMTDQTLSNVGHDRRYDENETLFPGGIDWRYVEGWHQVRREAGEYVLGPFVPNPDFVGHKTGSDSTTTQSQSPRDTADQHPADRTRPSREQVPPHHSQVPAKSDVPEQPGPGPAQSLPSQPRPADLPRPSIADRLNTSQPTRSASHQPTANPAPGHSDRPAAPVQSDRPVTPSHTDRQSTPSMLDRLNAQEPAGQPAPPQNHTQQHTHQDRPQDPHDAPRHQDQPSKEDSTAQRDPDRSDTDRRDEEPPQRPQRPLSDRLGSLSEELDPAVRDHVHSTPAGMSIFHAKDDSNEYYTAKELPKIPGQFVVDLHGNADTARVGRYPLTPKDVADIIRANPDYKGDPITVVGCETGRRDDGFAARLAQELGVPVTAPSTHAWVDYDGNVFATNTQGNERPGWPPNGEWRTFGPDGSQNIHESPYPPGHTPEWGDETPEFAPSTAERRGDREDDFRELREENREKREEGLDSVRELTGRNPSTDAERRPHERTLSTARYRSDRGGESVDVYNFSGKQHDWSPAAEAPQQPPKNERLFETSNATSYDPEGGGWRDGSGTPRVNDSEPKMFEDLARHQLAEYSGLSRNEVDAALREANKLVDRLDKADENYYRDGFKGEVQRTQDRMSLAIGELNKRAAAQAEANGTAYTPFSAADISGDLRMVVDLPSAKRDGTPAEFQICMSCQKIMLAYERIFPGMRLEVVNRAGERLYPL